ncbi:MAG: vWA domain-containing protein [Acidiferrobacteraceae bacterium]
MPGIETKLSAARTRLILEKPFLGALALRLPLVAADPSWCKTVATDARALYYNATYIDALSSAETEFVLAHEALHCALLHFARRRHRVKHRWDIACDLAINPLLIEDGLKPPPGSLLLMEFLGMTAEEIYPLVSDESEDETLDEHVYDDERRGMCPDSPQLCGSHDEPEANTGGKDRPPALSPEDREMLGLQWQQRMAGAAQQARQAGKLQGTLARLIDHLHEPQLPWRTVLAHYLNSLGRDDYSFMRPSKREGAAIMPSLRSAGIELFVVLDTSGSVSTTEMSDFVSEISALKGQLRARIVLHACDTVLATDGPWVCEPWEELTLPSNLKDGGGTSFVPPFVWAERQDRAPDVLVYFTDGQGMFPEQAPAFPVLWLVKGKSQVPWGRRIQLN